MKCPYCGGPIKSNNHSFDMSSRRLALYNKILGGGQAGVALEKIMADLDIKTPTTVGVFVHYINKKIRPNVIRRKNGRFRVERRGGP